MRDALDQYLKDTIYLMNTVLDADQRDKQEAWDVALGLMKIDLEPSDEFKAEVEREIRGEITTEDMARSWEKRHKGSKNE